MTCNNNHIKYCKLVIVLAAAGFAIGCQQGAYQTTAHNHAQYLENNTTVAGKHYRTANDLEEYVSRIGKRLVIVSENPMQDYRFKVVDTNKKELYKKRNVVYVSRALLKGLDDEAELAAVLAVAINKSKLDTNRMLNLSRAGYDPKALIDIKQKTINNQNIYGVFESQDLTSESLQENSDLITKLPQGLQRQPERYRDSVGI